MAELNVEEAKKDLQKKVDAARLKQEKSHEETLPIEEKKKLEEENKRKEEAKRLEETKSKREAEILSASEEEIKDPKKFNDEERKRRVELLEEKKKKEEASLSVEDKIKHVKEETQKRIDEKDNELRQIRDKTSKEAETLRADIKDLQEKIKALEKGKPESEDIFALAEKDEQQRITKYLEEDKDKPREQKKEMSQEEWEEWSLEEPFKAQQWMSRRELRRDKEKSAFVYKSRQQKAVKNFFDKVDESGKKVESKHPELNTDKRRVELKSQGKSDDEIFKTIYDENEKVRTLLKVVEEHPEFLLYENGPELAVAEMEKRLASGKPSDKDDKDKKIDELTTKVEELSAEIAKIKEEDEGLPPGIPPRRNAEKLSEAEERIVEIMKSKHATDEQITSALKKYKERKG